MCIRDRYTEKCVLHCDQLLADLRETARRAARFRAWRLAARLRRACFLACSLTTRLQPLNLSASRGRWTERRPFWALKAATPRLGVRQRSLELTRMPRLAPPWISSTKRDTGASGTTGKLFRILAPLTVSIRPWSTIGTWPFRSTIMSGRRLVEEPR